MPDLYCNASHALGEIKPLNGICNAPLKRTAKYWEKAAFPYTRLHDSFLGVTPCVDVSAVFPDFDADENEEQNYSFERTDRYIKNITDTGTEIIYRLGETVFDSIDDHAKIPPRDYKKWARICVHIIRHYNEGWANGFHLGIRYFEIWNEADAGVNPNGILTGTFLAPEAEFFRFYCESSAIIKEACPDVLVGGYAACAISDPDRYGFFNRFLDYLDAHAHAFDFLSYHAYGDGVDKLKFRLAKIDEALKAHGKKGIPLLVTEYEYFWESRMWSALTKDDSEEVVDRMVRDMRSYRAMAYIGSALCVFQHSDVYIANYYRTDYHTMWETTFTEAGLPMKPYYALSMFRYLREAGTEAESLCTADGVEMTAGGNADRLVLYIPQYTGIARRYSVLAEGLSGSYRLTIRISDEERNDAVTSEETVALDGFFSRDIYLRPGSITVLIFEKQA